MTPPNDNWAAGDAYDRYMGRWSRPVARAFIDWLRPPRDASWLEVGCGTGALTRAICELTEPASVLACDPSESFIAHAETTLRAGGVSFVVGDAERLPGALRTFDYVVSGLVLNFVPEPLGAIKRMSERLRRAGVVAGYVWDYREGMEFLRCFWDEAAALDSSAAALDEGRRFPLCRSDALESLFVQAGLSDVAAQALEVPTYFHGFDDFWTPFLKGTGPAPFYAASLSKERRSLLRDRLAARLGREADGGIRLRARAWAIRGTAG
jgi:SAM-dependent methyltransferase